MSFLGERDMANAALAYDGPAPAPAFPPVAERIRVARQALGVSLDAFARHCGLEPAQQYSLELHDYEVFQAVELANVTAYAAALGLPLFTLLFGEQPLREIPDVAYLDVAQAIERYASASGVTVETVSTQVGWDLQSVVDDPARVASFTIQGLFDVCRLVGLDWLGVLIALDR
jgi:transcriptional regulator with XRE-family HTH domain